MDIPDVSVNESLQHPNDVSLSKKYCHCIWEVRGRRQAYNPYAVCSASIYNHRGLKGPGPEPCVVTERFVRSLPDSALIAFWQEKGRPVHFSSRQALLTATLNELDKRGELIRGNM